MERCRVCESQQGKQGGFGAEQRHLMSEWQVIKISLSGYWRFPHCTSAHTLLLADRYTMERCKKSEKKKKKKTTVIFTFFCSPHAPRSSFAISIWIHSLVLSNFNEIKKRSTVTQSISAAFCPELMKSHVYWNWLCVLPWWWRDHHKDVPLFHSITQSVVASLGLDGGKKSCMLLSVSSSVIGCDIEALICLFIYLFIYLFARQH